METLMQSSNTHQASPAHPPKRPARRTVPRPLFLAATVALTACGVRELPPPAAPSKSVPTPSIASQPPDEGEGQVLIDTTNGPARVSVVFDQNTRVTAGGYVGQVTQTLAAPICASTPCTTNLKYGVYDVVFQGK